MRAAFFLVAPLLTTAVVRADDPPKVRELRTQRIGDTTYFHVRFERPANMAWPALAAGPYSEGERRKLAQLPRLVPRDGRTSAVYPRFEAPHLWPKVQFQELPPSPAIEGLEFVGKVQGKKKARFLLLYPTREKASPPDAVKHDQELAELLRPPRWVETSVKLDFAAARPAAEGIDLQKLWAEAQAAHLAVLEAQAPEFGFYGFACAATGRKYGVADPVLEAERKKQEEHIHRRMLDLTTGAAAITQSLALHRLRRADFRDPALRTIDVHKVPGIDIAEHPWKKMMGDKRPAAEPLAKLVPHDNYYIRFKSFAKFNDFSDFLDQWGTTASRAYEMHSRDYQLKERYEQQLCLKSTWLGRQLGPWLIRGIAVTGSDPYIREGSDVTVLFHVTSRQAFLTGVEQHLKEARAKFKGELKETKDKYQGIVVERFVTPLREVSVHRAAFGDFVVYSNSPVALRRVLDTHLGKSQALSDALDFQYMRTVFRADDREEDGFAFLSDAFIRQLVGPASKIKEMRRLEAMASLSMLTNGALFTAWDTGKLPAGHDALMKAAHLKPHHLYQPEGNSIRWDAARRSAVSDAYNTLHFATPLIELPIDKITHRENDTYAEFRREYLQLWRQFFDPVGIRFSLNKKQVKFEVYILPLIQNETYAGLRRFAGGPPIKFDSTMISPQTAGQFFLRLSPEQARGILGDWFFFRLDDSADLKKMGDLWVKQELKPRSGDVQDAEKARLITQLPWTFGVAIGDQIKFDKHLTQAISIGKFLLGPSTKETLKPYKEVVITRLSFSLERDSLAKELFLTGLDEKDKPFRIIVYHMKYDGGWYASFSEESLKRIIDHGIATKNGKLAKKDVPEVNGSFYISPQAFARAKGALRFYLEWETHKRALPNNAAWYALYRAGLIDANTPEPDKRAAALKFLGFIPVSPDDTAYVYDARTAEVVSVRHGSLRRPRLHSGLADSSPLSRLLEEFTSLRADMRFREDGMHAVVTLTRGK